jgi:hypothetical protein
VRKGSGQYIYKPGSKQPYEEKACAFCGEIALIRKTGAYCSKSCSTSAKWRDGVNFNVPAAGPGHPSWGGDQITYGSMHNRVIRTRGKATMCANRPTVHCTSMSFEWAHIHDTDPFDVESYVQLCASCHRKYDIRREGQYWRSDYR